MDNSGRLDADDIKALKEQEERSERQEQQRRGESGGSGPQNGWQLEQSVPEGCEAFEPGSPRPFKPNVSLI